jgi:hypothetical protein
MAFVIVQHLDPSGHSSMPEKLKQFIKHSTINGSREGATVEEAREPLQQIFAFLRTRTGHDFSRYKPATIRQRIAKWSLPPIG